MKTPDEIKKGLEYCYSAKPCADCSYDKRDFPHCVRRLLGDALDGYKQLESRLAQAEQDAKEMANDLDCSSCTWCEYKEFDDTNEACKECRTYNEGFKLRGVCAENTEEDSYGKDQHAL